MMFTFNDDYLQSLLNSLLLGGSLILTGCGGETTTAPIVTIAPAPVVAPASHFTRTVSSPLTNASLTWEAITVSDINGDGRPDIILANGGASDRVVSASDNRTTILLNDGKYQFTQLNTSNLSPTGWVNDWVILPAKTGNPYIIGIDHGREIAFDPKYWSNLKVFRYDNGSLTDLSNVPMGNDIGFYHNASSYGDLNNDGLMDFVTAELGNFSVFYGDEKTAFREEKFDPRFTQWGNADYIGFTGASVVLDIGNDGQQDFILLPFQHTTKYGKDTDGIYAELFRYNNGMLSVMSKFDARTTAKLPDSWGYSYAQVIDINKDGLQDFIALAEDPHEPDNTGQRGFVTFIQKSDGTFEVFSSMNTTLVDSKQSTMVWAGGSDVWSEYKFQLVDVDGDKNLDLFWGSWFNGSPNDLKNSVFYGDSSGHFVRNELKSAEIFKDVTWEGTARTHMTDLNNDGVGDLLVLQSKWINGYEEITPIVYTTTFG
jgi:hypothetical protein